MLLINQFYILGGFFLVIFFILFRKILLLSQQIKKNDPSKDIFDNILQNFDIEKIKNIAVQAVAKELKADRCYIVEYDEALQLFSKIKSEYLSSKDISSLIGGLSKCLVLQLAKFGFVGKTFKIPDVKKYLKDMNLEGSILDSFLKEYDVKSSFSFPIKYSGNVLGIMVVHFVKHQHNLSSKDIDFVENIINSLAISINQSELYIRQEKTTDREILLRLIIETIRSTFDSRQIKRDIVYNIGKVLKANRCFIMEYNKETNGFLPIEFEYCYPSRIRCYKDYQVSKIFSFLTEPILKRQEVNIANIQEFLENLEENNLLSEEVKRHFEEYQTKSRFAIPIIYGDDLLGALVVQSTERINAFGEDEIAFARVLAAQAAIALNQAESYEKQKEAVERESLLRNIIETFRNTIELNQAKQAIVTEIGKALKADRVFIVKFDPETNQPTALDKYSEYLSDPDEVVSYVGFDFTSHEVEFFAEEHKKAGAFIINDVEKFIEENNLQDTPAEAWLLKSRTKSGVGLPVIYGKKLYGVLAIHYTQGKTFFDSEKIKFIEILAAQAGIALYQAELYEKQKETAKREALLRNIIEAFRSNIKFNETKRALVTEVGKALKADRVFLVEFDPETNQPMVLDEYSEYLPHPEKVAYSYVGFDFNGPEVGIFSKMHQKEGVVIMDNLEKFIEENNLKGTIEEKWILDSRAKSGVGIPVSYAGKIYGVLTIHYFNQREDIYADEELGFLKTMANQVGMAIYQANLYEQQKESLERETLLRKIIETARSTFDLNQMKKNVVTEIGKALNADRVFIVEFDPETQQFRPLDEYSEYLPNPDLVAYSFVGFDFTSPEVAGFAKIHKESGGVIFDDLDKFIEENNMAGTLEEKWLAEGNVKACITIPITHSGILYSTITLHYTREYHFSREYIKFIETLAAQLSMAFYQANLYKKEKEAAERESLLRKMTATIRQSLDLKETKKTLVDEIGRALNANRVFLMDFDPETSKLLPMDEYSEYVSSPDEVSFVGLDIANQTKFIIDRLHQKKIEAVPDIDKYIEGSNLKGTIDEEWIAYSGIKSGIYVPVVYNKKIYSSLAIQYTKEKINFSEEQIQFVEILGAQIGIALKQASLYEKQKEAAEKEALLRKILETVRSTLDINQMKKIVVTEIGKVLNADRTLMVDFNFKTQKFLPLDEYSEYLPNPDAVPYSLVGFDFSNPDLNFFSDMFREKPGTFVVNSSKKLIEENNLQGTNLEKWILETCSGSGVNIPIIYNGILYSTLTIQYVKENYFTNEQIEFIETLGAQLSMAFYQAHLYKKQKESAEREALLRTIIEMVRRTLNLKEIKRTIVTEIGKIFNANRIFIIDFDLETGLPLPLDENSEYLSSPDEISFIGIDFRYQISQAASLLQEKKTLAIDDMGEFIERNNLKGTADEKWLLDSEMRSAIAVPILQGRKLYSGLVIQYTKENIHHFTEEEIKFVETLGTQIGIAFEQAILFNRVKQHARKESILRHIISEIKLSTSLEQTYSKLMEELARIYKLNRVLFLESSPQNRNELIIKSEYVINNDGSYANNLIFPQVCIDDFLNLINNFKTLVIHDVMDCYPDKDTLEFFRKYKIQSLMATPLVKQNKNVTVFGFVILCAEEVRRWTAYELDLLKSISESVISILWEISRFNEVEDLRNSFVITLAHDFQVPLIGERNALEYLVKYASGNMGADRALLNEVLENNKNLIALLGKSVDIYNYEAGKKDLHFYVWDISSILKDVIEYENEFALTHNVTIEFKTPPSPLFVKVDRYELLKVFNTIVENAIEKSPRESKVLINVREIVGNVEVSIEDHGPGIPEEIQKKIFNRYEMALAIERKIGAGVGLFLAKRVMEAHDGQIYFETEQNKGTVFYVVLPIAEEEE